MTKSPEGGQSRRLIVTGSTGTLGHNLLATVSRWPNTEILALLRAHSNPIAKFDGVRYEQIDFFQRDAVAEIIKSFQPTSLIHCAASGMRFPKPNWFDLIRFNVDVSLSLCESVAQIRDCQFVYISTGLSYRDQGRLLREEDALDTVHPYGASKAAADILMRAAAAEFGVPMVVLRPFSFSGVGDTSHRLFPSLLRAAAAGQPFELSPGDQVRDHCAVEDIAEGITQSMLLRQDLGPGTHVFNLGSASEVRLRELVEDVVDQLGLKMELKFCARDYVRFEPKFLSADISRACQILKWRPRTNFAYAIWRLAQESFPTLQVKKPRTSL